MIKYQNLVNADLAQSLSEHNVLPEYKELTMIQRQEVCKNDRLNFQVAILNVTGELNIGTIIRNSLLMGATKVLIIGRRFYDKRGTVGSEHYINVERIESMKDEITIDTDNVLKIFNDRSLSPIYIEQGGIEIPNFNWVDIISTINASGQIPVLVVGNENRGVPNKLLNNNIGVTVSLPQKGVIRSYNVGVASGMVMLDMVSSMCWW